MEWKNVVAGQRADPEQINKIGNQVAAYKGLRLARRIVLTEVVATIEFNTDSDGNALNSTLGGELVLYSGANASFTTSQNVYIQLNNQTGATSYWYTGSSGVSSLPLGVCGAQFTNINAKFDILANNLIMGTTCAYRYATSGYPYATGGGMTTPRTAVTSVKLFLSSGTFPAGTVVEWWERG